MAVTVLGGNAYITFVRHGIHSHAGAWERETNEGARFATDKLKPYKSLD